MLIINKDTVIALKQKLDASGKAKDVIDDVRKMLEIKQALVWRSTAVAPCCGSLNTIASQLSCEVNVLEKTVAALESDNTSQASCLLEEYMHVLEEGREQCQPDCCQS